MTIGKWTAAVLSLAAFGCDVPATQPVQVIPGLARAEASLGSAGAAEKEAVNGAGIYLLSGSVPVHFEYQAQQGGGGEAGGQFSVRFSDSGFDYDITGAVTCLATDPATGHAWVGGVVTRNTSTDPDLQMPINQPGRDVWFRVLDAGEGNAVVDRTSFLGFEGAAGIHTSAEYCAARIWPAGNARTWPVVHGEIIVH